MKSIQELSLSKNQKILMKKFIGRLLMEEKDLMLPLIVNIVYTT